MAHFFIALMYTFKLLNFMLNIFHFFSSFSLFALLTWQIFKFALSMHTCFHINKNRYIQINKWLLRYFWVIKRASLALDCITHLYISGCIGSRSHLYLWLPTHILYSDNSEADHDNHGIKVFTQSNRDVWQKMFFLFEYKVAKPVKIIVCQNLTSQIQFKIIWDKWHAWDTN